MLFRSNVIRDQVVNIQARCYAYAENDQQHECKASLYGSMATAHSVNTGSKLGKLPNEMQPGFNLIFTLLGLRSKFEP